MRSKRWMRPLTAKISTTVPQTTVPHIHRGPWGRPARNFIDLVLNLLKVVSSCRSKTHTHKKWDENSEQIVPKYIFLPGDAAGDDPPWSWRLEDGQAQHPGRQQRINTNLCLERWRQIRRIHVLTPNSDPVFPMWNSSLTLWPAGEFPLLSWPERLPSVLLHLPLSCTYTYTKDKRHPCLG